MGDQTRGWAQRLQSVRCKDPDFSPSRIDSAEIGCRSPRAPSRLQCGVPWVILADVWCRRGCRQDEVTSIPS
jgi:hypothetical protein